MSWNALFRPAGRRGARVYWRRRLLAFVFLFVVALAGLWAVARSRAPQPAGAPVYAVASPIQPSAQPNSTGPGAQAQPQETPAGLGPAQTPAGQPSADPQAPAAGEPGDTGAAQAAPTACQDGDISVRVTPSALQVGRGGEVSFALVVSDRSVGACDVGGLVRTVQVVSSAGTVWSSARCGAPAIGPTLVRPGVPATFQVTWNTRSCGLSTSGPVTPGAYDVTGRVGGLTGFGGTLVVR